MKHLITITLVITVFLTSTKPAQANMCQEKIQQEISKHERRKSDITEDHNLIAEWTMLTAGWNTIGALFLLNPPLLIVSGGIVAAAGAVIGVGSVRKIPRNIAIKKMNNLNSLISEAKDCRGPMVAKTYKRYTKQAIKKQEVILSQREMCNQIVEGNENGSLCSSDLPSVKQVAKFYIIPNDTVNAQYFSSVIDSDYSLGLDKADAYDSTLIENSSVVGI
jgi:hypothetical protein